MLQTAEVLRGDIVPSNSPDSLSMVLLSGEKRTIALTEVHTRMRELRRTPPSESKTFDQRVDEKGGGLTYYQGILQAGFGRDNGDSEANYARINFSHGIGMDKVFSIGLGTGVRLGLNEDFMLIPLFLNLTLAPIEGKVSPILHAGAGNSWQTGREGNDSSTGSIAFAELGVSIRGAAKSHFMITVGFESLNYFGPEQFRDPFAFGGGNWRNNDNKVNIQAITFNVAVGF